MFGHIITFIRQELRCFYCGRSSCTVRDGSCK